MKRKQVGISHKEVGQVKIELVWFNLMFNFEISLFLKQS